MDRLVCCILLLAICGLVFDLTKLTAYAMDTHILKTSVRENSAVPEKEDVEIIKNFPDVSTETSQKMFFPSGNRNELLDNIFNIPIATLQAVNNLVQSIAGNLQQTGRNYLSGQLQTTHSVVKEKENN